MTETFPVVALGERGAFPDPYSAAFKIPDESRPVVDFRGGAGGAVSGLGSLGEPGYRTADFLDGPQQLLGEVDSMNGHVEQVAGARLVLILAPPPAGLGKIQEALAAEMPGCSKVAFLNQVLQVAHRRREAIGKGGHVNHSCGLRRAVHRGDLVRTQAERFFAHDVLAAGRGRDRKLLVGEVRRGDDDSIHILVREDLFRVGGDLVDLPVDLAFLKKSFVGIADGHQPGPRIEPDSGNVVVVAHQASADDGKVDLVFCTRGHRLRGLLACCELKAFWK